ncbi:hypothetical protein [Sulfitobacter pontiacus]|uniref:hypothetical protein n=1 Tax=Sulfitobacter pontiacus TaxID=60137 RepID=UPI0010FE9127|nr:hypothetical protein [Sulfitobacter pontiacus]
MAKAFVAVLFPILLSSPIAADENECVNLETDRLAAELCQCRQIESDIQRLQCFDRQAVLEMVMRRQADARAEWLSRQPFGIEAMRDRVGDQSN